MCTPYGVRSTQQADSHPRKSFQTTPREKEVLAWEVLGINLCCVKAFGWHVSFTRVTHKDHSEPRLSCCEFLHSPVYPTNSTKSYLPLGQGTLPTGTNSTYLTLRVLLPLKLQMPPLVPRLLSCLNVNQHTTASAFLAAPDDPSNHHGSSSHQLPQAQRPLIRTS